MSATATKKETVRAEPPPLPRFKLFNRADPHGGYSRLSLVIHWIGFLMACFLAYMLVVKDWYERPQPLDLAIGVFLLYQCLRRLSRGFPRNANTWLPAAFLYRMSQITMLLSIGTFALTGLLLILLAGQSKPTILGFVLVELFNDPLPWWQAQAEFLYRFSALTFAGGACVTMVAVGNYAWQAGMPNLKRLIFPSSGGR